MAASGGTGTSALSIKSAAAQGANALIAAQLAAVPGQMNYLTGVEITGAGATAASVVTVTIFGLLGASAKYTIAVPAGVSTPIQPLVLAFNPPLAASAVNSAIQASLPAFGAGNTDASVTVHGYSA